MPNELNQARNIHLNNLQAVLYTKNAIEKYNKLVKNLDLQVEDICKKLNVSRNELPNIVTTIQQKLLVN